MKPHFIHSYAQLGYGQVQGGYMAAETGELFIQVCIPSCLLPSCFPNNLCYLLRTRWTETGTLPQQ